MASPTFLGLKGQNLVYAVTFCSSIGFLLFGYDLGFMGGLTTSPKFLAVFNSPSASLLGFLVSSYEVGALIGALFQFMQGDRVGRKRNNIAGAIIVCIGAILQATSFGLAQFLSYIVFAVINFITVPVVYLCYPETSKLPLEAVDLLFADRNSQRPSLFQVVRDSMDKDFVSGYERQLQDTARVRALSCGNMDGKPSHVQPKEDA